MPNLHSHASAEPFGPRLQRHLADLLRLAWPVMLSRAGILIMAFTDIAMLGHYGPGAAGIANLGLSIFVPVLVIVIGLSSGVVAVVAHANGRGDWAECGRAWRRTVVWSSVLSFFGVWIVLQTETFLLWFGQTPEMAAAGGAVGIALAPGLFGQVLFAVSAFYLEATRRPMVALWVMIGANIANFIGNWFLIFGHAGFPELGPVGAAIASSIARFGAAGAMIAVILWQRDAVAAGVRGAWETFWGPGGWRAGYTMRKLGLSAGLSGGFETTGFAAMTMFAGQLGPLALDAYSISHNIVSTIFMVGLGLAIATGVRVGMEAGRGRRDEAAFAGWTGFLTALIVMTALGVVIYLARAEITALYTADPAVTERTLALLVFAAFIFVPDAAQILLGQSVRALGDAWIPIICYGLSFTVMLVPLGWYLGLKTELAEAGLVVAIIISCIMATITLSWRFRVLTRTPPRSSQGRSR